MNGVQSTMTEEAKEQLTLLFANMIEIKSYLTKHCTLWCIKGPSLGASAGITAIVQEEDGHVSILQKLRDSEGLNALQSNVSIPYLQESPRSWTQIIVDLYVFDTFVSRVIKNFEHSTSTAIVENIQKMIEEEYFHEQFSKEWALLLANSRNFQQEFLEELMKALDSCDGMMNHFRSDVLVRESLISEEIETVYKTLRQEIMAEFDFLKKE
jgi:1,2-phenylacetyl-CoA epoxidase catalytic subunit